MATKRPFQDFHWLAQVQAYETTITWQWDLFWKNDVPTLAALPMEWNTIGDCRIVKENWWTYKWIWTGWSKISNPIPHDTFDDTMSDISENAVMNKTIKSYVDTKDATKQDKLTAWANIQISQQNVISATDTKYTAGTNVSISDENVISATDTTYSAWANISINGNNQISADVPVKIFNSSAWWLRDAYIYYVTTRCYPLVMNGSEPIFLSYVDYQWSNIILTYSSAPYFDNWIYVSRWTIELDSSYNIVNYDWDAETYRAPVSSVNGNIWAVVVNDIKIWSSAPANPTEWMVWYDTTNNELKSYDWTNWNTAWWGSDVKTFFMSDSSQDWNISVWQDAFDWVAAGKTAIISYTDYNWYVRDYILDHYEANYIATFMSTYKSTSQDGSYGTCAQDEWKQIICSQQDWVVTNVTTISGNAIYYLDTINSVAFTPTSDYQPATKKYVDDNAIVLEAWAGINIKDYTDCSAVKWPCPTWFHVPTRKDWSDLWNILSTMWASNFGSLLIPLAWRRNNSDWAVSAQWTAWQYWAAEAGDYAWDWCWCAYSDEYNNVSWNSMSAEWNWFSIRPFKDEPVVPDSSWTTIVDGSWATWISWTWVFQESTLWLLSISNDWTNWITIADKNLWATVAWSNWDTLSETNCWYYYQWWNNNWFAWTWSITTSSTKVDASAYWPDNYYSSSTFITDESWDTSWNMNLWWWLVWTEDKTNISTDYSNFAIQTATAWATLTVSDFTTQITPNADFSIVAWTVKEWMQYIVRVNSWATAYTMTLWTWVTNPYGETLTLTANKVTTLVFFATSSSTLELFGIKTAA